MHFLTFYCGIPSGIYSDILFGILSGICSGIFFGMRLWHSISNFVLTFYWAFSLAFCLFYQAVSLACVRAQGDSTASWPGDVAPGPSHGMPRPPDLAKCPLRSGARGWGPAVPTAIWNSLLGGGRGRGEEEWMHVRKEVFKTPNYITEVPEACNGFLGAQKSLQHCWQMKFE